MKQIDRKKDTIKDTFDRKRSMRLNRFFANKRVIISICCIMDIFIFLVINFIFNFICNVPKIIEKANNFELGSSFIDLFSLDYMIHIEKRFWWIYLLFLILLIAMNLKLAYNIKISYEDINKDQKGSSRWTTLEEIKEQYREIPEKETVYPGKGGVPVCRYEDKIYIDDSPVNNLIIGITRSGKGEMFVFPMIDIYSRAEEKSSMIIADPKLELAASSYQTLIDRGYEVHTLNLIDPIYSMGFNPLQLIIEAYKKDDLPEAQLLCSSFCYSIFNPAGGEGDDQFFNNNATYLLSALILAHIDDCLNEDARINKQLLKEHEERTNNYITLSSGEKDRIDNLAAELEELTDKLHTLSGKDKVLANRRICELENELDRYNYKLEEFVPTNMYEKKINMRSVIDTFTTLAREEIGENLTALDIYFRERPDMDVAKYLYSCIELAGDRTKGSIYSNTLSKLLIFTYDSIAQMTAESTVNLRNIGFGEKPVAIFLGIPDYDRSNHFIASVFIRQTYFVLAKSATHSDSGKCDREVIFILDEFGNLPAIESMDNIVTVCLGRNIRFNLVIQAYSQIENLYKDAANTIVGNCGNHIYIQTNDNDTAELFSKLVGSETITNINRSGGKMALSKSFTEMPEEKPLINSNELMELTEGQCVVKRTMKRKSLNGKDVKPRGIFNKDETRFKYRYQYLAKDFPSGKVYRDVCNEDRKSINLKERVLDINKLFSDKEERRKAKAEIRPKLIQEEEKKALIQSKYNDVRNEYMSEIPSSADIYEKYSMYFEGISYKDICDLTVAEIETFIPENELLVYKESVINVSTTQGGLEEESTGSEEEHLDVKKDFFTYDPVMNLSLGECSLKVVEIVKSMISEDVLIDNSLFDDEDILDINIQESIRLLELSGVDSSKIESLKTMILKEKGE